MCRLDVICEGYCHNSMDNLVEETKVGICPSLVKGSQPELVRSSQNNLFLWYTMYTARKSR